MDEELNENSGVPRPERVAEGALATIERAQIDVQISTAKKYPRVLSKVKEDMMAFACLDDETAASCFYTLPRAGKTIQGPSVRMAEIALSCFGNIRAGSRVIEVDIHGDSPHVTVQSVCHDLEKNVAVTIEKRRRVFTKRGKANPDEDDINLACNACSAVAFRDAIYKVIPQALIKPVWQKAKRVAVGQVKSVSVKRDEVFARLKQMGTTEDRILSVIACRKPDDVGLDHLEILIGLGTALRDGEISIEEAFPLVNRDIPTPGNGSGSSKTDVLTAKLAGKDAPASQDAPGGAHATPPSTKEPPKPAEAFQQEPEAPAKVQNDARAKRRSVVPSAESLTIGLLEKIKAKADLANPDTWVRACEQVGVHALEWQTEPDAKLSQLVDVLTDQQM